MLQDIDTYASAFVDVHMIYSVIKIRFGATKPRPQSCYLVLKVICGAENLEGKWVSSRSG